MVASVGEGGFDLQGIRARAGFRCWWSFNFSPGCVFELWFCYTVHRRVTPLRVCVSLFHSGKHGGKPRDPKMPSAPANGVACPAEAGTRGLVLKLVL